MRQGTTINMDEYAALFGGEDQAWGWSDTIPHAVENGWRLCKYEDPIEGAREDLTEEEALEIAYEAPGVLYVVKV